MKPKRVFGCICVALLGLLFLFFLLAFAASPTTPGAVIRCLPMGWWHFLQRNTPLMSWNWGLIATGLICSVLVVAVGNGLLRALFAQLQQSRHSNQPLRHWPWRWTVCGYILVWLLFAIAFGATGVLRHTTWLMSYRQPWFQESMHPYSSLKMADLDIRTLVLDTGGDLQATRKAFYSHPSYRRRQTLMVDEFDVIFYGDTSNKVAAYLMVPRRPQPESTGRFGASIPGAKELIRPISDLGTTIAELEAAYPERTISRLTK
jgi:hypothetical protein